MFIKLDQNLIQTSRNIQCVSYEKSSNWFLKYGIFQEFNRLLLQLYFSIKITQFKTSYSIIFFNKKYRIQNKLNFSKSFLQGSLV